MALHIQDPEADRIVREFAQRRGVGITDAIKLAVKEAEAASDRRVADLRARIEPIIAEVRAALAKKGKTGEDVRRAMDEGWDGL